MKFKDEYVLARGWPYFPYGEDTIGMVITEDVDKNGVWGLAKFRYPRALELDRHDCPKYELVLRRVIDRKNQTKRS